jgi:hypothetical protein
MRLIALKEILLHKAGDEFDIGEAEARALIALQIAKPADEKPAGQVDCIPDATRPPMTTDNASDLVSPRRRYRRRDMKADE